MGFSCPLNGTIYVSCLCAFLTGGGRVARTGVKFPTHITTASTPSGLLPSLMEQISDEEHEEEASSVDWMPPQTRRRRSVTVSLFRSDTDTKSTRPHVN